MDARIYTTDLIISAAILAACTLATIALVWSIMP